MEVFFTSQAMSIHSPLYIERGLMCNPYSSIGNSVKAAALLIRKLG